MLSIDLLSHLKLHQIHCVIMVKTKGYPTDFVLPFLKTSESVEDKHLVMSQTKHRKEKVVDDGWPPCATAVLFHLVCKSMKCLYNASGC